MKAYQARGLWGLAVLGFGLGLMCLEAGAATPPAASGAVQVRARARTLIFRPNDLPGFKLIQSGSLDTSGFTRVVVEGERPRGYGWEQRWKRSPSKALPGAAFVNAGALLCPSARAAEGAVRGKMSGIAAHIEWQDRLSTSPPAAADRLFVSPRDPSSYGVYQVFGTAGKLAFHVEIHPAEGALAPGDPALVDELVRRLLARYARMK